MSIGRAIEFSLYNSKMSNCRALYTAYKLLLQLFSFVKSFKIQIRKKIRIQMVIL